MGSAELSVMRAVLSTLCTLIFSKTILVLYCSLLELNKVTTHTPVKLDVEILNNRDQQQSIFWEHPFTRVITDIST